MNNKNNHKIRKNNYTMVLLASAVLYGLFSCMVSQKEITPHAELDNAEVKGKTLGLKNTPKELIMTEITRNENRDPEAFGDFKNHFVGKTIKYSVLDNDCDPDGDEVTIVSVSGGFPNIIEWEEGDGTITVTRVRPFSSLIWYTISDGKGGIDSAAISLRRLAGNLG